MSWMDKVLEATSGGGGSSVTVESLSVTANGTYTAPTGKAYSPVDVSVSGSAGVEEKDVNFYDYDGTCVAAYSAADFASLDALPDNPAHDGLTAQGWNWSLSDAKAYVASYGFLDIGQMYVTSDGKTRIYVQLQDGRLSPIFAIAVNGTATVNFGDGSAEETLTGTSLTTAKSAPHTYQSPGRYTITAEPAEGSSIAIIGNSYGSYLFVQVLSNEQNKNKIYSSCIEKVEIGANCTVGSYAFAYCASIRSVTIPSTATSIGGSAFTNANNLQCVTIPTNVESIGTSTFAYNRCIRTISLPKSAKIDSACFQQCDSLTKIALTAGKTTFGNSALSTCNALKKVAIPEGIIGTGNTFLYQSNAISSVTIPSTVTTLGTSAFNSCYGLAELHFKPASPPMVSNSNTFTNLPTDCILYVPYSGIAGYLTGSNYPSNATYTYLGYATYTSGDTLPAQDSTSAYNVTWYATGADAKAGTNPITQGNGKEVYCTWAAA